MTPLAYTIEQAAEIAGVTPRTVRAWIATGALRAKRQTRSKDDNGNPVGVGKYLILHRALEDCLDSLPDG